MSTTGRSDQVISERRSPHDRPGDGYLLLELAEAAGWQATITAAPREQVEVVLRHPLYGEVGLQGTSVADVAVPLVEWALLRSRFGHALRLVAERCSTARESEVSRNGAD